MSDEPVNALAEISKVMDSSLAKRTDNMFDRVSKSSDYFPRLQLSSGASDICKKEKVPLNTFTYVVSEDNFIDCGKEVDILPLSWRPKAIDMSGSTPVAVYDADSEAFKSIEERSNISNSRCSWGPEFLVWIPGIKKFATLMMGSKSARPESKNIREQMMKGCTLKNANAQNDKYTWRVIQAFPCTTPFALPSAEEVADANKRFEAEILKAANIVPADPVTNKAR